MVIGAVLLVVLDRDIWAQRLHSGPLSGGAERRLARRLAALFFAGSLARDHHAAWPGWIGGVICAAIGIAALASVPGQVRVTAGRRGRRSVGLPLIADGSALLIAVLSIVAPPLGLVALLLLLWLLYARPRPSEAEVRGPANSALMTRALRGARRR